MAAVLLTWDATNARLLTTAVDPADVVTKTAAQTLDSKTLNNPRVNSILDSNGTLHTTIGSVGSAVNYFQLWNNIAGAAPQIEVIGSDTNIPLNLVTKGNSRVQNSGVTMPTVSSTDTLTNKTLTDATTTFADDGDATKKAQLQCSGITTGTTRTYSLPDANATLLGINMIRQHAAYTLANSGSAQQLFNATTNGRITLPVGSYRFQSLFSLSGMSATSGNASFSLAGSATLAVVIGYATGMDSTSPAATQTGTMTFTSAFPASMASANVGTGLHTFVTGGFEVTVAGTVIPTITLVTAAAAVVAAGSFFECWQVTPAAATTTVGAWD